VNIPNDLDSINNWTIDNEADTEFTSEDLLVGEYDSVNLLNSVNFYAVLGDAGSQSVGRITYDKITGKFSTSALNVKFEKDASKKDQQVYKVGCDKTQGVLSKSDRCAFSTYGATVYFAQMTSATTNPPDSSSSSIPVSSSETTGNSGVPSGVFQVPVQTGVNIERFLRLRRNGSTFIGDVYVAGDFVVGASERLTPTSPKSALMWDVKDYGDGLEVSGDFGVADVLDLIEASQESTFDSEVINLQLIDKFDGKPKLWVLNYSKKEFYYTLSQMTLRPYTVVVVSISDETEFNKYNL
jgi:hypothetical protein